MASYDSHAPNWGQCLNLERVSLLIVASHAPNGGEYLNLERAKRQNWGYVSIWSVRYRFTRSKLGGMSQSGACDLLIDATRSKLRHAPPILSV